nr:Chain C, Core protein [Hepatitis B virus]4K7F_F Chain F, Core protein [Hepatitis B virus]
VCWGELMNL